MPSYARQKLHIDDYCRMINYIYIGEMLVAC